MTKQLGYQGKLLIHPDQVGPVNEVFTPSADEVEYARKVVAAYRAGALMGLASVALDGKMVDAPVAERARNLLALAESIAQKS